MNNHRLLAKLAFGESEPRPPPAELPEWRQDHSLLLLLLGDAMSRLAPLLLQEEEGDSKDGKDGREDRKKKLQVLHTACY